MLRFLIFMPLLNLVGCSNSSIETEECVKSHRIIGGYCTSIVDRPFQALLFIGTDPKCGGSIISNYWILTAAHCVQDLPEGHFTISVGSAKVEGPSAQYYSIKTVIVHEDFVANKSLTANDIALLRTSKPINFTEKVKPIELNGALAKTGDDTVVSGFGVTDLKDQSSMSNFLMSVDGKVIETKQCQSILTKLRPEKIIPNGTFCAGNLTGGKDSCRGDSGGPITIGTVLAGLVSWGINCAESMVPAFYTDVAYYRDWISNHTKEKYDNVTENDEKKVNDQSNKIVL